MAAGMGATKGRRLGSVLALALVGCSLDTGSAGSGGGPDLADGSGTTSSLPAATDTGVMSGSGPDGGSQMMDTGDSTGPEDDDGTTTTGALPCGVECRRYWVCEPPSCINPDEDEPCQVDGDCGPAAPWCGPDERCHDGSVGDPCEEQQCEPRLVCGPSEQCQAGVEGEPCDDATDCGAAASLCGPSGQCQDGGKGDTCEFDGDCGSTAPFCYGPASACQDGSENDPCEGESDCGPSAPHCTWDDECHDGSFGDPCSDNRECNLFCVSFFCV
ncbi:MAG: hypothetical protein AB1Z98_11755 [Nannocystaceae bacterium]